MGEYANNKIHAKFLKNKIINKFVIVEDTFHKKNSERHMAIFYWLKINCSWVFKGSLGLTANGKRINNSLKWWQLSA